MKKIVIAGAGQFGRSAAGLLNTGSCSLIAFGDNNPAVQGTWYLHPLGREIPVLSMEEALAMKPDAVLTGIIDEERTTQLTSQIRKLGFEGEILPLRTAYELFDVRSAVLLRLASRIREAGISGSIAELGVYKGDLAWKLNALFPDRPLYLFDTFEGFDERDTSVEASLNVSRAAAGDFGDTSVESVRNRLPHPEQAVFCPGFFPDSARELPEQTYAFVSMDVDLYAPTLAGLNYFLPRLSRGGMILLHDYNNERFRGAKKAVEEYESLHGCLSLVPLCDLHGSAVILN